MPQRPHQSSSADLVHEREVLEELLKSEGWTVFVRRVATEWRGEGYFARMGVALKDTDPLAPKVIHNTSIEVERMIQWPVDRLKHLGGIHE